MILLLKQLQQTEQKPKLLLTPTTATKISVPPSRGVEVINILNMLEKAVVAAQVTSILFEPQIIQQDEWFTIYPIKLELKGDYKKLLTFINNVLQPPYLVIIEEFNIQKKKDADEDDLTMQILLMVYKNKYATVKNISTLSIPTFKRDIFKQEIYRKNLFLWSSKELRFLGLIKQGQMNYSVVGDPLGGIYRVTVGDKIGLKQSEIVAIDKCGIKTTEQAENIHRGEQCI